MTSRPPSRALQDVTAAIERCDIDEKRPRRLLDLPVDILKDIVKEIHHTTDLCSLALCHSALHALAVPHIYSRFDIVWPDTAIGSEPRSGVDALTYGLSTLVMAEEVFGKRRKQSLDQRARRGRGNYYAQFTRKFSLGNGPPEWVQDYLITKEGGKMLGTMVALAIARMRNLESFVWDMPTGILCAVWDALASLDDRDDHIACRLERVAVRWHPNLSEPQSPVLAPNGRYPTTPPLSALDHVEHPSFSILPPLKSLSVLDIDEVQYLDEMSVLISRSIDKLRELRVGIAPYAVHRDFVVAWDGDNVEQIDKANPVASCITLGEKRLGGVLGVLTGLIFDMRAAGVQVPRANRLRRRSNATIGNMQVSGAVAEPAESLDRNTTLSTTPGTMGSTDITLENVDDDTDDSSTRSVAHLQTLPKSSSSESTDSISLITPPEAQDSSDCASPNGSCALSPPVEVLHESKPTKTLALEVFELEHTLLSIPVLQHVIDWSKLTTLTLLQCVNHEHLWKMLRRLYTPVIDSSKHKYSTGPVDTSAAPRRKSSDTSLEYKLNLRNIHTDTVSSSLVSFIKDTLRPNSLESVFLQQSSNYTSTVSIDTIFRGVLRKHRMSLRRVLIDSGEKSAETLPEANTYWRRWVLNRDILRYLASAKMPALRELGAALDYRDWHYFLQNLPSMPQLHALYIPFLVNFVHGNLADTRELALQIVDIVVLRPEIQLCYLGLVKKCFEILEHQPGQSNTSHDGVRGMGDGPNGEETDGDYQVDDGNDDLSDDEHDHDDDSEDSGSDETESEHEDTDSDESEHIECGIARFRLREILYYDDKVSIFKARHGRL